MFEVTLAPRRSAFGEGLRKCERICGSSSGHTDRRYGAVDSMTTSSTPCSRNQSRWRCSNPSRHKLKTDAFLDQPRQMILGILIFRAGSSRTLRKGRVLPVMIAGLRRSGSNRAWADASFYEVSAKSHPANRCDSFKQPPRQREPAFRRSARQAAQGCAIAGQWRKIDANSGFFLAWGSILNGYFGHHRGWQG